MKLASIFTHHAVLQRNMHIPVWGVTEPDTLVRAELAGKTAAVRSSSDGDFLLRLPSLEAGGPYTLKVSSETGEEVVLEDIMIGEVWLASGQSNMEYALGNDLSRFRTLPEEERAKNTNRVQLREFLEGIRDPSRIRAISVPRYASGRNERSFRGEWERVDAETAPTQTAVGLWFARFLEQELDVTVGIINSSAGGTGVEAWTSRQGLMSDPKSRFWIENHDELFYREEKWKNSGSGSSPALEAITCADPGNEGFGLGWAAPDFDDSDWSDIKVPGSWIKQGLAGNGSFWVRRKVTIPENWAGRELVLHLGGVDKHDTTYFNGVEIGRTGKGFDTSCWDLPRNYKVPADLVKPGEAVIAIRAYSFLYDGSFNSAPKRYKLSLNAKEEIPLAGVWKGKAEKDIGCITAGTAAQVNVLGAPADPVPYGANTPGILFHSMINPLIPYGIRGVIWYQGEHNAGFASEYRRSMGLLIRDWRFHWGQGDFPFIQVQLAGFAGDSGKYGPFNEDSAWARQREAQAGVCQDLPEAYLATAVDVGDPEDVHPQNKKDVGYRLAQSALYHVYLKDSILPCGPVFEKHRCEGRFLRVFFRYGDGMYFQGGTPRGFFLAGRNGVFHPATEAKIEGRTILLACDKITLPLAVRYSWADCPDGNLRNRADLPAFPFRTANTRF